MPAKKFFSLIHGGSLHVAPDTKVIPADQFSTLQDANETLEQVQRDAEQYRKEVTEQCEQEREQAQREGFEVGMQKWAALIIRLEKSIEEAQDEVKRLAMPVALKAAKKIVGREIEQDRETVVDIITNTLKAVSQHQEVNILVNPKDLEILEANRPKLKACFDRLETLTIQGRNDVKQGGCVIETEVGIIDAELENQWLQLERLMETLMESK